MVEQQHCQCLPHPMREVWVSRCGSAMGVRVLLASIQVLAHVGKNQSDKNAVCILTNHLREDSLELSNWSYASRVRRQYRYRGERRHTCSRRGLQHGMQWRLRSSMRE